MSDGGAGRGAGYVAWLRARIGPAPVQLTFAIACIRRGALRWAARRPS